MTRETPLVLTRTDSRYVAQYPRGIRVVVLGDRESWTKYIIAPRRTLVAAIRKRRARGAQYHDCDTWRELPRVFSCAGGDNPGGPFAREPWRIANNRRFVVYAQSGGLDV